MIRIGFVGNCQTLGLLFFFKDLVRDLNYELKWICYREPLPNWKIIRRAKTIFDCEQNIIQDIEEKINYLKKCNYIIYQPIKEETSINFNFKKILSYSNKNCKLISFITIFITKNRNFKKQIKELSRREQYYNTNIKISNFLKNYEGNCEKIMLSRNHPTTITFLELIKQICNIININFFDDTSKYLKNINFIHL